MYDNVYKLGRYIRDDIPDKIYVYELLWTVSKLKGKKYGECFVNNEGKICSIISRTRETREEIYRYKEEKEQERIAENYRDYEQEKMRKWVNTPYKDLPEDARDYYGDIVYLNRNMIFHDLIDFFNEEWIINFLNNLTVKEIAKIEYLEDSIELFCKKMNVPHPSIINSKVEFILFEAKNEDCNVKNDCELSVSQKLGLALANKMRADVVYCD